MFGLWPQIPHGVSSGEKSFYIIHIPSGKALDVYQTKTKRGTNVHLWTANKNSSQKWKLRDDGSGTIIHPHSGKVLAVDMSTSKNQVNRANVHIWKWDGTPSQQWILKPDGSIINQGSGKALTIEKNSVASATSNCYQKTNEMKGHQWGEQSGALWIPPTHTSFSWSADTAAESIPFGHTDYSWSGSQICEQECATKHAHDSYQNGTNVLVFDRKGTESQRWRIVCA